MDYSSKQLTIYEINLNYQLRSFYQKMTFRTTQKHLRRIHLFSHHLLSILLWRHEMGRLFALLTLCEGNLPMKRTIQYCETCIFLLLVCTNYWSNSQVVGNLTPWCSGDIIDMMAMKSKMTCKILFLWRMYLNVDMFNWALSHVFLLMGLLIPNCFTGILRRLKILYK